MLIQLNYESVYCQDAFGDSIGIMLSYAFSFTMEVHGIDNIGLNMPVGGSHGYITKLPVGLSVWLHIMRNYRATIANGDLVSKYLSNLIGILLLLTSGNVNLGEQCRTAYTPCMSVAYRDLYCL